VTGEQQAWAATFAPPLVGLAELAELAELADAEGPWGRWARGVLLQAGGDYATAFALWEPLTTTRGELAGLAAARLASGLRQLDEHLAATQWDDRAITAPGRAATDGLIGRAADAVGVGDAVAAAQFLARARERADGERDQIRVSWVACEIDLLRGRPRSAADHASRAHDIATDLAWPRHQIKSALFLGAALRHHDPARATRLLHHTAMRAEQLSLLPLVWPTVLVLGDEATTIEHQWAAHAVQVIESQLPGGVGRSWAERGDIAHLSVSD
jgi:hypothetical protein